VRKDRRWSDSTQIVCWLSGSWASGSRVAGRVEAYDKARPGQSGVQWVVTRVKPEDATKVTLRMPTHRPTVRSDVSNGCSWRDPAGRRRLLLRVPDLLCGWALQSDFIGPPVDEAGYRSGMKTCHSRVSAT
jgi:hypothetical protein